MTHLIPSAWMPACPTGPGGILRLIVHWTGGAGSPETESLAHYHYCIDRVGLPRRGDHPVTDNLSIATDDYAAHTRGLNAGSIGLALCGMAGAVPDPFAPGRFPLTLVQWQAALIAAADLCVAYQIIPAPKTLLMHCEVEAALGVPQAGKWDISVRTWHGPPEYARMTPGEELRQRVKQLLGG